MRLTKFEGYKFVKTQKLFQWIVTPINAIEQGNL